VKAELKCKCDSELMDFLREVLFRLIGRLTWVDYSSDLFILKVLRDVILASDQRLVANSFSALIASTRRVSPLVQKVNIFKDSNSRYDMYRLQSEKQKSKKHSQS